MAKAKAKSKSKPAGKKPAAKAAAKPAAKKAASAKPAAKAKASAPQKKSGKSLAQKAAAVASKVVSKLTPKTASKADSKKQSQKEAKASPQLTLKPLAANARTKVSIPKNFLPLDDRVLVLRAGVSDRTPGGLYIPDTVSSSERPSQGEVIAVGKGHRDKKGRTRPLDVQLGDTVMFAQYSGSEVRIDDQDFMLLREADILGVVKAD